MRRAPEQKPGRSQQDRVTPVEFIEAVTRRWGPIDVDLAASDGQQRAPRWITPEQDTLAQDWCKLQGLLWLNPRFCDAAVYLEKCKRSAGPGRTILVLLPASVSTDYFARHVWPAAGPLARVIAVRPRIAFVGESAGFPKDLMLVGYGLEPGFETWNWKEALMVTPVTRIFHVDDLRDAGLPDRCEGGETISNTIVGKSRWSTEYKVTFRLPHQSDDTAWCATYRVGSTEAQDEAPWEHDETVECTLVQQRWVHRQDWVPVDKDKPNALAEGDKSLTHKLTEARLTIFKARERLQAALTDRSHPVEAMVEVSRMLAKAYEAE